MKYKLFSGQGADIEKKINEWLTPTMEIHHLAQSSFNAQLNDKVIPITMISVFYSDRLIGFEGREVE